MRTLALLAALLLLALQAQAQNLQGTADQDPAQDQPEAEDQDELWTKDQDEAGAEDQDVAITFTGEERLARAASGPGTGTYCHCTLHKFCNFPEKHSGSCRLFGRRRKLCCR